MTRAVLLLRLVPSWLVGIAVWGVLMVAVGQLTTAVGGDLAHGLQTVARILLAPVTAAVVLLTLPARWVELGPRAWLLATAPVLATIIVLTLARADWNLTTRVAEDLGFTLLAGVAGTLAAGLARSHDEA